MHLPNLQSLSIGNFVQISELCRIEGEGFQHWGKNNWYKLNKLCLGIYSSQSIYIYYECRYEQATSKWMADNPPAAMEKT